MRVISGMRRGSVLFCPEIEGLRPTTDRVKENIFNLIQNEITGRTVLDLFAGSGAMGIEALSRGVKSCVFCDTGKEAAAAVKKNLAKTGFSDKATVKETDAESYLSTAGVKFSLVFLDPPYHSGLEKKALDILISRKLLSEGAIIIYESDGDEELKVFEGINVRTVRSYGRVKVTVAVYGA